MKRNGRKTDWIVVIILVILFLAIIGMNAGLISNMMVNQTLTVGETRLENIKNDFDKTFAEAENTLLRVANGAEQLLTKEAAIEELSDYIKEQKKIQVESSHGVAFNVYIAGRDYTIIPDFDMPPDYHATERLWYVGAADVKGEIYITEPYEDSMTGNLCYTMSVMLSDSNAVVAMDFTLSDIQASIQRMSKEDGSTALIVTSDGMVVGFKDMSLAGTYIGDVLPDYSGIYRNILNKSAEDYQDEIINGEEYTVFHSKTDNNWYMILCVKKGELYGEVRWQIIKNIFVGLLMLSVIIIFFFVGVKSRNKAERALKSREKFVENISGNLVDPLKKILWLSDQERVNNSSDIKGDMAEIKDSGMKLKELLDNLNSYKSIVEESNRSDIKKKNKKKELSRHIRRFRNAIIIILTVISVASVYFLAYFGSEVTDFGMSYVASLYEMDIIRWDTEQLTVLRSISDMLEMEPEIADDYDRAVKWLDKIASGHSDISACYLANPYKTPNVIMNSGWIPEEGWKVEERDWYRKTEKSPNGYSVSSPYFDEQTGNYCITMSKMIYTGNNDFLGILGIDFYMDKLMSIIPEYSVDSLYIFMVDSNGDIISHPNPEYRISEHGIVNVTDTEYRDMFLNVPEDTTESDAFDLVDYNGKRVKCLWNKDITTGIYVVAVADWFNINQLTIWIVMIYLIIILICIIAIIKLLNGVIRSQANMNDQLAEAVEKAEAAGKAKSDFLAQMSHEIRTPINAVIGMDEMILRESKDPEINEYAHNIKSASNTLLSLINGILDFSKLESGKMEIVPVRYGVVSAIDDLVHMIKERAVEKGLELILEIDPKLPKVLFGDEVRLKQIIVNLLTNAVKYTKEGSITFTMHLDGINEDSCRIFVGVSDTGMGIKPEDINKLGISFQRLDEEKNRNIEGTGLGMSIVQGLLVKMDSELKIESVYGKGSRFSFVVEQKIIDGSEIGGYTGKSREEIEENSKPKVLFSGAEVLVVDDNDMNLKVAKGLLKGIGIVPDLAESGKECIQKVKEKQYHIILMDHMMPGLDGIETLHRIREQKYITDDTVVIALTANAIVGAKEMYLAEGFADYLSKPMEPKLLEEMFIRYLPKELMLEKEYDKTSDPEINEENKVSFTEILRKAGFDVDSALKYCMNDEEFYKEILETFVSESHEKKNNLTQNLDEGDIHNYQINVHALKSGARTIGAMVLSEMALEHENAAKDNNTIKIRQEFDILISEYKNTVDTISKAI